MREFIFLAFLLASVVSAYANSKTEVRCVTDYHVLAKYKPVPIGDRTAEAIERKRETFVTYFEDGELNTFDLELMGREITVGTGLVYDSSQFGGAGTYINGLTIEIFNPLTSDRSEIIAPFDARVAHMSSYLHNQPGVLPNETSRIYIWTVSCRW